MKTLGKKLDVTTKTVLMFSLKIGALTVKQSAFSYRPWEVDIIESIDLQDSFGSNIYIHIGDLKNIRILPKKNKNINEHWITNRSRFLTKEILQKKKNIFNYINKLLKNEKACLFINTTIDLQHLFFFQQLKYFLSKKITFRILSIFCYEKNLSFWGYNQLITNIVENTIYFFFGIFSESEIPLIKVLLNRTYLSKFFSLYSLNKTTNLKVGKNKIFTFALNKINYIQFLLFKKTEYLMNEYNTDIIFLLNKNTQLRITHNIRFLEQYKNFNTYFSYILLESSSNSSSFSIFNSFNTIKEYKKGKSKFPTIFLNQVKKYLKHIPFNLYYTNEFSSEPRGIYLNFEQRPQLATTSQIHKDNSDVQFSFQKILQQLSKKNNTNIKKSNFFLNNENNALKIFSEIALKDPELFFFKYPIVSLFKKNNWSSVVFQYSNYPLKKIKSY